MQKQCDYCERLFTGNAVVWSVEGRLMCSEPCCERWIRDRNARVLKAMAENLPAEVFFGAIVNALELADKVNK